MTQTRTRSCAAWNRLDQSKHALNEERSRGGEEESLLPDLQGQEANSNTLAGGA